MNIKIQFKSFHNFSKLDSNFVDRRIDMIDQIDLFILKMYWKKMFS
ncbi:MAG: hypothetical protein RAP70_00065 [Candidatus Celaenobacter antarcticus]|nr:hypothetical protein [Candidatus Celaenobacter antarcticus]